MEDLEGVRLLSRADEGDGLAGDLADGERAAAAGVTVHLRHDDAVEVDLLCKGSRRGNGVLAGHGVDHQEDVVGLDRVADRHGLLHHGLVHMQAAGGVDDDDVAQVVDGVADGALGDRHRVCTVAAEDAHALLVAEGLQLVCGRRAVDVAGGKQRGVAHLGETVGELGARGGLAGALQAHHHDDAGDAAAEVEAHGLAAQQGGELVVDDLDDVLGRGQAVHDIGREAALLGALDEALHHLVVDVCLEQRHADLLHGGVDVGLRQAALALEAAEDALELCRKVLEH